MLEENVFLLVLALIWVSGAVLQDLRRREVDNIWNFSLIAFALAYRAFISISMNDYTFFANGVIGLLAFVLIGNILYYGRFFAGGDAKLLIALGAVLPLSYNWTTNLIIFGVFILLFIFLGSGYVLVWSLFLVGSNFNNFRKELKKQLRINKKWSYFMIIPVLWIIIFYYLGNIMFAVLGLIILFFPILFVYAKSVEESCMVREVNWDKVTEGDWLYKDVKIGRRVIKAHWEGLSKNDLEIIKKGKKKVMIKYGVPFTPSFLLALIALIYINYKFGWF